MTQPKQPITLFPGMGKEVSVGNARLIFKLVSERTDNKFSITEYELPAGFPGPPPHKHKEFEHAWYILEGKLTILLGEEEKTMSKDEFVYIPKKIVHAFSNTSNAVVRLLAIDTPGGFENYYEELKTAFTPGEPQDPEVYRKIQLKYDTYPPDYIFG